MTLSFPKSVFNFESMLNKITDLFKSPKDCSDYELALGITKSEKAKFEELFRRYSPIVLGYAKSFLKSVELAEDCSQEVWLKVVKASASFDENSNIRAWILTVTRNYCLDQIRKKSNFHWEEFEEDSFEDITQEALLDQLLIGEQVGELKKHILNLPENQRIVLNLWMTEEMSLEEVGKTLKIKLNTVKSHIHRAKESLKLEMKK